MKFWRHAAAAVLAIATLALLIWRTQFQSAPATAVAERPAAADPGYVATGAEIIETGPDGQPRYRLLADRVEQPWAGADIRVTQPRLVYRGDTDTQWSLRADTGVLPAAADRVDLSGSVYVVAARAVTAPVEIRTDSLGVDMTQQVATTRDPVHVTWGRDQVSAVGLRADLKADTLRLESQVHGDVTR